MNLLSYACLLSLSGKHFFDAIVISAMSGNCPAIFVIRVSVFKSAGYKVTCYTVFSSFLLLPRS